MHSLDISALQTLSWKESSQIIAIEFSDCGLSLAAASCAVGRVSLRGSEHAIRSGTIAGRNMAGGCQRYMDLPFMDTCSESPCHSGVICTCLCACLSACTCMCAVENIPAASNCLML